MNSQTTQQNTNMSQADAIKVLIRAVQVAQSKGVYNLDEAAVLHQAVQTFIVKQPTSEIENALSQAPINKVSNTVNNTQSVNSK